MVTTRSMSGGNDLAPGLPESKKSYPYLDLKRKDAAFGYPMERFYYQRNGKSRIYFVRPEDMPKDLDFPSFATEEQKKAALEKYRKYNFNFLPEGTKPHLDGPPHYRGVLLSSPAMKMFLESVLPLHPAPITSSPPSSRLCSVLFFSESIVFLQGEISSLFEKKEAHSGGRRSEKRMAFATSFSRATAPVETHASSLTTKRETGTRGGDSTMNQNGNTIAMQKVIEMFPGRETKMKPEDVHEEMKLEETPGK